MTGIYSLDIECDHRTAEGATCLQWAGTVTGRTPPTMAEGRAEVAADGWVRRFGPSSCAYDLCPDHHEERPGVTFPDWRKATT